MKISKSSAEEIAKKLTEGKRKEITETKNEIKDFVYGIALGSIPSDVLTLFNKNPDWFHKNKTIVVSGIGLRDVECVVDKYLPNSNGSWCSRVEAKVGQATKLSRLVNIKETQEKQCNELYHEIYSALLSLGTTTRIAEKFPEAARYLPVKDTKELVVNIDNIRKKLR